jgi:hypothetical protein
MNYFLKQKNDIGEMITRIRFKNILAIIFILGFCTPTYSQSDTSKNVREQKIELSLAYGVNYIFFNDYFDQEITTVLISAELFYRLNDKFLVGISYYYNNYDQVNEVRFGADTIGGQVQYDFIADLNVNYNWHQIFAFSAYVFDRTNTRLTLGFGLGPVFLSYEEKMTIETAGDPIDYNVSSNVVGFGLILRPKLNYFILNWLSIDIAPIFEITQINLDDVRTIDLSSKSLSINAGVTFYF